MCRPRFTPLLLLLALATVAPDAAHAQHAQDERRDAVRNHIRLFESAHRFDLDALVDRFERQHAGGVYLSATTNEERRRVLETIQRAADGAGGVVMDVMDDRYVLTLSGRDRYEVIFAVADAAPFGIETLVVRVENVDTLELTRDNIGETIEGMAAGGMAGVAFVRLGDEIVFEEAFGPANGDLGIPNSLKTIFGIGSRPIDFTVAAVHLLDQMGRLQLDDPIPAYFDDVPADKHSMTIQHLLAGASGLPDFFHAETDWDPDLAWIDRRTGERRLLAQELLFEPGSDRRHSHGAFVLLAALVEKVSGHAYYAFLREHFFDPAGMERTGEYGETRGLSLEDFAAGGGPQRIGLPNIPPNWGPTSWLIKGSGGMYSTLGDLRRFYEFVRSGSVLDEEHQTPFLGPAVNVDGSDRGFELFSIYAPDEGEAFVFLNRLGDRQQIRRLFQALERLVLASE